MSTEVRRSWTWSCTRRSKDSRLVDEPLLEADVPADLGGDGAVLGREALVPREHLHQGTGRRQRRAQLVAQQGQEVVLGPVSPPRRQSGGEHPFGDVERDPAKVRRLAVGPAPPPRTEGAPALSTSGRDEAEIDRFQRSRRRPCAPPLRAPARGPPRGPTGRAPRRSRPKCPNRRAEIRSCPSRAPTPKRTSEWSTARTGAAARLPAPGSRRPHSSPAPFRGSASKNRDDSIIVTLSSSPEEPAQEGEASRRCCPTSSRRSTCGTARGCRRRTPSPIAVDHRGTAARRPRARRRGR